MAAIELRGVRKAYGQAEVIKGIDLSIAHGEFCVFVGPSGCGKSTLLRMISGLEGITEGDIAIGGEVVNNIPAADRGQRAQPALQTQFRRRLVFREECPDLVEVVGDDVHAVFAQG